MQRLLLLLTLIALAGAAPASAYTHPSSQIHASELQDAVWIDASGTLQTGIDGSGQFVVTYEPYNADIHPAMADCYGRTLFRASQTMEARNDPASLVDYIGHGTATASAVCATWETAGSDFDGVALGTKLLSWSSLYPGSGDGSVAMHEEFGPRVLTASVSFANPTDSPAHEWTPYTEGADMVFTWAAGNTGGDGSTANTVLADGDGRAVIVGALDAQATAVAAYSSTGKKGQPETYPTLVAPGCMWVVQEPGSPGGAALAASNHVVGDMLFSSGVCPDVDLDEFARANALGYTLHQGTSFSAPLVAGVFAMMFQVHPTLDNGTAIYLATRTADHFLTTNDTNRDGRISPDEFHAQHGWQAGWGRINATAAITAAHYLLLHPDASAEEAIQCARTGQSAAGTLILNPGPSPDPCGRTAPEIPAETPLAPNPSSPSNNTEPDSTTPPTSRATPATPAAPTMFAILTLAAIALGRRR